MDQIEFAVKAENLERKFGKTAVLQGLSFQVGVGEKLAILGANGAGKTTLLRILVTLLLPTQGRAFVMGKDVARGAREVRRNIGWASASDSGFVPELTGRENLLFFGALNQISPSWVSEQIEVWSEVPAIQDALTTPYYLCSSGMRQSLNLARAFLKAPPVVMLDEPTRSLDQESTAKFFEVVNRQFAQTTVVFTTHEEGEIAQISSASSPRILKLQKERGSS